MSLPSSLAPLPFVFGVGWYLSASLSLEISDELIENSYLDIIFSGGVSGIPAYFTSQAGLSLLPVLVGFFVTFAVIQVLKRSLFHNDDRLTIV